MAQTIFEKYGGFKTISKVVMTFYDLVLDSDQIGDYFDDIDMGRLVDHQTKFVASLLGGPASFSNERLRQVHQHLAISDTDFDEMARILGEAMAKHGMDDADIGAVISSIEAKRSVIVARSAA
ncbi:MAG: group 1 truncated hemoglobin [Pseudomonadota bacterium]